jgi:hypothetical protein
MKKPLAEGERLFFTLYFYYTGLRRVKMPDCFGL